MSESLFQNLHDEARARVIWGESPAELKQWLIGEGLTEEQAEVLIAGFKRERAIEIRRSGMKRICSGLLMLAPGLVLLAALGISRFYSMTAVILAVGLILGGFFYLVSGILRVIAGRFSGSVTDLD